MVTSRYGPPRRASCRSTSPLGVDQPHVPDRRGETQLRQVAKLKHDRVVSSLHEPTQRDQQAVLVPHLLHDAVPARGKSSRSAFSSARSSSRIPSSGSSSDRRRRIATAFL